MNAIERIDAKMAEARKTHAKACQRRDDAIRTLTRAANVITKSARTLARLEKQRAQVKAEARKAQKQAKTEDRAPIVV